MALANPETTELRVHLLPTLSHPHELAGHPVVVVDVLRASTTMTSACAAGVAQILPCLEVAEARRQSERLRKEGHDSVLLGGERGGALIPGFDLGNSPAEYTAERIRGKSLVFTTTNGTRALMRCVGASRVIVGCFANLGAVAQALAGERVIHVMCAGTDGEVSWEDTLFAGALVEAIQRNRALRMNDSSLLAMNVWRSIGGPEISTVGLAETFRLGIGGQNLLAIGRQEDLRLAAQRDQNDCVPELDLSSWVIRPSR
jgi:2-phosphosulfolactate phosphatase